MDTDINISDLHILNLPADVWYLIFEYLDTPSLLALQYTSTTMQYLINDIPPDMIMSKVRVILSICSKIEDTVMKHRIYFTDQDDFLLQSLSELGVVIQNCLDCKSFLGAKISSNFWKEMHLLQKHLADSLDIIEKIARQDILITDTFDILDFSIRRYTEEIDISFNLNKELPLNMSAVSIWHCCFGKRMFVPFDGFMNSLQEIIPGITQYKHIIQLFYNFPRDNVMTYYRFQLFLGHFGPWGSLFENLEVACNAPFIGLVNSNSVYKFIEGTGYYVIRFSRKSPSSMTLSYHTAHQIKHVRAKGISHIREIIKNNKHKNMLLFESASRFRAHNIETMSEYTSSTYGDLVESFH